MAFLQMVFYTLIVLGVLVTFHEFGHFWVARRCGIKVLRFSIGFGTPLLRWRDRHDTEFVIALLPLGGYVKMLDEREGDVSEADAPYAFNRKSVGQRMATVAAGPIANFILAVLLYWVVYMLGVQGVAPVIGEVVPGSIAEAAGLEAGQEILSIDGEPTPTWQTLGERLVHRIGDDGDIRFTVSYADSNLQYSSVASLAGWQIDAKVPDPIGSIGIELYRPLALPLVDVITPDGASEQAGFLSGDLLLSADGVNMVDWYAWVEHVRARPEQAIAAVVERDGQTLELSVTPRRVERDGEVFGQVGMSVVAPEWPEDFFRETRYGPGGAFMKGLSQTGSTAQMIFNSIGKMLTGALSVEHLSGPITIAKVASTSAEYGLVAFLQFMALLSVSLGVLNLLPVPVLDGGHLLYYAVEAIKGSPVSLRFQQAGQQIGLFLIIGLMVLALYNDLLRL
ncbi:MAG: RIP metalloprotease RseP [Gammaproteobacteria bacterium]|nr:RIP metalloprotease RseP [Gammaproteobacteria bacterium]MBQ0839007.1 RIP metalloprotease RseP [Gammaproteobacteria bacterium]